MNLADQKPFYLHIIGEISKLSAENMRFEVIDPILREILSKVDINVIKHDSHEFPGGGLSIVYILSASHLAIHTWPEMNYMHFDLITCSPKTDYEKLKTEIERTYSDSEVKISLIDY